MAGKVNFWQARQPDWRPRHMCAITAAAMFFSAESRQDSVLTGASCGGPVLYLQYCKVVSINMCFYNGNQLFPRKAQ